MQSRSPRLTLVSGPAASGKSRWAEHLAQSSGLPVLVLATGPNLPDDPSWQRRVERHRQRRPAAWRTLEVGGGLSAALAALHPGLARYRFARHGGGSRGTPL